MTTSHNEKNGKLKYIKKKAAHWAALALCFLIPLLL
jgi:hypothetical protein